MDAQKITHQDERDATIVARKLIYVAIPGALGLLFYAAYAGLTWSKMLTFVGMGTLVALASLLAGGLVGFLFGIPKSADSQRKSPNDTSPAKETQSATGANLDSGVRRNTNIEEISDWLTKIIVGLGIYELKKVPVLIGRLSRFLSSGFADVPGAGPVFIVLFVSFSAAGFLFGYLLTVLFVTKALVRVGSASQTGEANLKDDARTAQLIASVAGSVAGTQPSNIRDQILALANRYVTERASRPSGDSRTMIMEEITREMRQLAVAGYSMLKELTESDSPGQRLAATAFLQVQPSHAYLDWLIARLPKEVPFIQYQMALALRAGVRALADLDKQTLKKRIAECQKSVRKGSDEYRILDQILAELD